MPLPARTYTILVSDDKRQAARWLVEAYEYSDADGWVVTATNFVLRSAETRERQAMQQFVDRAKGCLPATDSLFPPK